MSTAYRFIEPLDVLFLRGNKLFGDPGSHGESLVPPWPSVAAGALRSAILGCEGIDLVAFARGSLVHPTLGTPAAPGTFAVTGFDLARRAPDGSVTTLHALPADLVLAHRDDGGMQLGRLQPALPASGLASSAPLTQWPLLAQAERGKPVGGHWLTQRGWAAFLAGQTPATSELVAPSQLWEIDARVGVGLDAATRRAEDGKLFSMQAVAFRAGVGFLAEVRGAELPTSGTLRLGGDGRGAAMHAVAPDAVQPDLNAIAAARRCRIVLTTPGLFAGGWLLPGVLPGVSADYRWSLAGITGRLTCAAVQRAEVVSGWDLARARPKPAERAAPTGSVYWIDDLEATADQLRKLVEAGLWDAGTDNAARRAEGFNRFSFATY